MNEEDYICCENNISYIPVHLNVASEEATENEYDEIEEVAELPKQLSNTAAIPVTGKSPKYFIKAAAVTVLLLTAVTFSLLLIPLIETSQRNEIQGNDSLNNATQCVMASLENCSPTDMTEGDITLPTLHANSCSDLPNSSLSGYYWVLASNGSTIRVFCDMNMTCGNITGGWMRVASLDMNQPSSECPSNLCLYTTAPRTCRRCYGPGKKVPPVENYRVGISYSDVCGRVIAYQVGKPNAYHSRLSNGVDGITLTYGAPEVYIWTFVAATHENYYRYIHNACPCLNLSDHNIPEPPEFISNNYFCDTAASMTKKGVFYKKNPLWDGVGCKNNNQCCSFNHPPWFYRRLPESTSEPIKMKINLNEKPSKEDLAIEVVDIYVQ